MKNLSITLVSLILLLTFNPASALEINCDPIPETYDRLTQAPWPDIFNTPMISWIITFEAQADLTLNKVHAIKMPGGAFKTNEPVELCSFAGELLFKRLDPGNLKQYVPFKFGDNRLLILRMGFHEAEILEGIDYNFPDTAYNIYKQAL